MGRDHTREQEEQEEGGTTVLQYCDAKELVDGLIDFCTTRVSCCHVLCHAGDHAVNVRHG